MIYNDIHILNLENLTWIELKAFGVPVSKVCGHTVASIDGKMLIFGGKLKIWSFYFKKNIFWLFYSLIYSYLIYIFFQGYDSNSFRKADISIIELD